MQISSPSKQTRRLVLASLFTRINTDTLVQMFYAFLPILASGIGVSPVVFGRLLSVRSSAGFLTPLFGNLAERRGYRVALPVILMCGAVGAVMLTLSNNLALIIPAIFILGIGITTLQPMLAAYTSGALPEQYRARGMGIIEYAWAFSSIVGVYLVGQLLKISTWQWPLLILGALMALMALVFARLLRNQPDLDDTPPISIREQFTITENRSSAYGAIAIQSFITFAGLHFFISYSIWLVDQYDFGAVQLATVVLAFGFVDLIGSGLVSVALDRLGRRRALVISGGLSSIVFFLIGLVNGLGLVTALVVLFLGRFLFEVTIVAGVITVSEQSPNQRSRVMSIMGFVGTFFQALAGLTGPFAAATWGIVGLSIPTGIGFALTALLAWRYIR